MQSTPLFSQVLKYFEFFLLSHRDLCTIAFHQCHSMYYFSFWLSYLFYVSTYKVKFANDRHSIDVYVNVCICIQDMYSTADGCLCGWVKVIQLFQCPIQRHVNSQYFDYCDMRTVLINGELERGLFFFFFCLSLYTP